MLQKSDHDDNMDILSLYSEIPLSVLLIANNLNSVKFRWALTSSWLVEFNTAGNNLLMKILVINIIFITIYLLFLLEDILQR